MTVPKQLPYEVVKSYRYLRLAIVIVVLALIASVMIEGVPADCWQGSFSAYYYTPAHAMFIGALISIGVCLIAIKGGDWEDVLLNVAGILAGVVAVVPTSRPSSICTDASITFAPPESFIDNNVVALFIGGIGAIGVSVLIINRRDKRLGKFDSSEESGLDNLELSDKWGLAISVLLAIIGITWYFAWHTSFLHHAHAAAAVAMFVLVGLVAVINARSGGRNSYTGWYWAVVLLMIAAAIGVGVANWLIVEDWRHSILLLETLELSAFALFWILQTLQHWDYGIDL